MSSKDTLSASPLFSLPQELLLEVLSYCSRSDFWSLGATGRIARKKTETIRTSLFLNTFDDVCDLLAQESQSDNPYNSVTTLAYNIAGGSIIPDKWRTDDCVRAAIREDHQWTSLLWSRAIMPNISVVKITSKTFQDLKSIRRHTHSNEIEEEPVHLQSMISNFVLKMLDVLTDDSLNQLRRGSTLSTANMPRQRRLRSTLSREIVVETGESRWPFKTRARRGLLPTFETPGCQQNPFLHVKYIDTLIDMHLYRVARNHRGQDELIADHTNNHWQELISLGLSLTKGKRCKLTFTHVSEEEHSHIVKIVKEFTLDASRCNARGDDRPRIDIHFQDPSLPSIKKYLINGEWKDGSPDLNTVDLTLLNEEER